MNRLPEEDRLTAYALGELSPAEAAEVEVLLATSAEARQELDEIRACAGVLTEALRRDAEPVKVVVDDPSDLPAAVETSAPQLDASIPEVPSNLIALPQPGHRWGAWLGVGLAAGLTVAVGIGLWQDRESVLLAKHEAPEGAADPGVPSVVDRESTTAGSAAGTTTALSAAPPSAAAPQSVPPVPVQLQRGLVPVEVLSAPLSSLAEVAQAPTPAAELPQAPGMAPTLMHRYGLMPGAGGAVDNLASAAAGKDVALRGRDASGAVTLEKRSQERSLGLVDSYSDAAGRPVVGDSLTLGAQLGRGASAPTAGASVRSRVSAASASELPSLRRGETWEFRERLAFRAHEAEELQRADANPGYVDAGENLFVSPLTQPLSTFGLDVDTGSYANVRRFLKAGSLPPRAAVRVEEMLNYFDYAYPAPSGDEVFRLVADVSACPWQPEHRIVRVALKTRDVVGELPVANLVFLVDLSGSMQPGERLPLLKNALRSLAKRMSPTDRVAIVTYASGSQLRLPSTTGEERDRILEVIDALEAGGSTNGEGGIRQAYAVARQHFINGGVNRVILCTDGDFNVGMSDQNALVDLIRQEAKSGVFLTTLGVGTDNFKDALMRRLADSGNGSYHYLDSFEEAHRVLLEQQRSRFVVVARDAKAQVEFNPATVAAWRQIGYEKRALPAEAFNDDTKDGGEVGAGQTVTMLYEVVPAGVRVPGAVDALKYQPAAREVASKPATDSTDLLTFKVRYQRPEGSASVLRELAVRDAGKEASRAAYPGGERDRQFTLALVAFAQALRDPSWQGGRGFDLALELAREGQGADPGGVRAEFMALVRSAKALAGR